MDHKKTKKIKKELFLYIMLLCFSIYLIISRLGGNEDDDLTYASEVNLVQCELSSIVDGDTIWVIKDGKRTKVRFIGIDTPESVHADTTKNNEYGEAASDFTKSVLKDIDSVYLEYDVEPQDKYGRELAYVWLNPDTSDFDNNCVNALIISNGYAMAKTYAPNTKYDDKLIDLCKTSIDNNIGLWKEAGFRKLWEK